MKKEKAQKRLLKAKQKKNKNAHLYPKQDTLRRIDHDFQVRQAMQK